MGSLLLFLFAAAFYLLPWVVAKLRKSNRTAQIAIITIFLGWTGIGWIIALIMAVGENRK